MTTQYTVKQYEVKITSNTATVKLNGMVIKHITGLPNEDAARSAIDEWVALQERIDAMPQPKHDWFDHDLTLDPASEKYDAVKAGKVREEHERAEAEQARAEAERVAAERGAVAVPISDDAQLTALGCEVKQVMVAPHYQTQEDDFAQPAWRWTQDGELLDAVGDYYIVRQPAEAPEYRVARDETPRNPKSAEVFEGGDMVLLYTPMFAGSEEMPAWSNAVVIGLEDATDLAPNYVVRNLDTKQVRRIGVDHGGWLRRHPLHDVMTPAEIAATWDVKEDTVRDAAQHGWIPARKSGATWLMRRADAAARWGERSE